MKLVLTVCVCLILSTQGEANEILAIGQDLWRINTVTGQVSQVIDLDDQSKNNLGYDLNLDQAIFSVPNNVLGAVNGVTSQPESLELVSDVSEVFPDVDFSLNPPVSGAMIHNGRYIFATKLPGIFSVQFSGGFVSSASFDEIPAHPNAGVPFGSFDGDIVLSQDEQSLYGSREIRNGALNDEHFWRIDFPAGEYEVIRSESIGTFNQNRFRAYIGLAFDGFGRLWGYENNIRESSTDEIVRIGLADGAEKEVLSLDWGDHTPEKLRDFATLTTTHPYRCDVNQDLACDFADYDALLNTIEGSTFVASMDIDGNQVLDDEDASLWRLVAAVENQHGFDYLPGDANLDGRVDALDLNEIGISWLTLNDSWSKGDFTRDGRVDARDLNILGIQWQQSSSEQPLAHLWRRILYRSHLAEERLLRLFC